MWEFQSGPSLGAVTVRTWSRITLVPTLAVEGWRFFFCQHMPIIFLWKFMKFTNKMIEQGNYGLENMERNGNCLVH